MATNRAQKKKKKREQKRKSQRRQTSQLKRVVRSEEYGWAAFDAHDAEDHATALAYAQKRLKVEPDDFEIWDLALHCAVALEDEKASYTLLCTGWKQGFLDHPADCIALGQMAMYQRNNQLALDVFTRLEEGSIFLQSPLNKRQRRTVADSLEYLEYLENYGEFEEWEEEFEEQQKGASRVSKSKGDRGQEQPDQPLLRAGVSRGKTADSKRPEKTAKSRDAEETTAIPPMEDLPQPEIVFEMDTAALLQAAEEHNHSPVEAFQLALEGHKLSFRTSYDQLLCLPTLHHVQSLQYQQETARKVLKTLRGRAILADEVGLGKTIEAGLVLKEYHIRGLVRSALILTPSSLVNQWREELEDKFGLTFVTTNDPLFRRDPEAFWSSPFVIASIHTAKSKQQFDSVTARSYDMLIVDEAHHLKNRTTLNWKLVNSVQKTFLLLLTATPVQNNLEELFNLVTLLKPGHLKTRKAFKEEFVSRGSPTDPRNREKLRGLLKEVMIRNTRSVTQLHLPPRFAYTTRVSPDPMEKRFYEAISEFTTDCSGDASALLSRMILRKLLEAAGSSHIAATNILENIRRQNSNGLGERVSQMLDIGRSIEMGTKLKKVLELVQAGRDQVIVFVNYTATLEYLHKVLHNQGIPHAVFQGGLPKAQKQAVIEEFRGGCPVLLSTGIGGEGHNLQFCHTMINYDLPWNPMEIEQRIGRIHRIGQQREVQVYNFCACESIEDHILDVLDRKINMFELVIGEMDMILGRLRGEKEFNDMVYEIWVQNHDESARRKGFSALAERLKRAKSSYETSKELDEKLFQEDFDV